MRMICPRCGLSGTAGNEYYLKKVQCPDCLKVFTAAADVLVDPVPRSADMAFSPDAGVSAAGAGEKQAGNAIPEDIVSAGVDSGVTACEVCGFRFSSDFIRIIDGRQICPVCSK